MDSPCRLTNPGLLWKGIDYLSPQMHQRKDVDVFFECGTPFSARKVCCSSSKPWKSMGRSLERRGWVLLHGKSTIAFRNLLEQASAGKPLRYVSDSGWCCCSNCCMQITHGKCCPLPYTAPGPFSPKPQS